MAAKAARRRREGMERVWGCWSGIYLFGRREGGGLKRTMDYKGWQEVFGLMDIMCDSKRQSSITRIKVVR